MEEEFHGSLSFYLEGQNFLWNVFIFCQLVLIFMEYRPNVRVVKKMPARLKKVCIYVLIISG